MHMNELDKIFRSKLENHTEEYSSQSWDKIQSRLMQQKTKPKKFPWLWMSLVSLVVVGALYLFVTTSSDDINTQAISQSESSSIAESKSLSDLPVTLADDSSEKKSTEQDQQSNALDRIITNEKENLENATSNSIASSATSREIENQKNNNNKALPLSLKEHSRDNNELVKNEFGIDKSNILDSQESKTNTSNTSEIVNINSGVQSINSSIKAAEDKKLDIRPLRTIGVSSYSKLYSIDESKDIELSQSMMDDFRQDCPSFVTDRTGVYLDFYVSHEMPFSSLSAKNEQFEPYKGLRAETEGPSYSFSAGARLTLMLPNGLGLKTGLNYSQVNEKFSYVDPESVMTKAVITITNVGGSEMRDTNYIEIPGTREIVSTNKYRSFDIPLLLSYEWDVRERTYMTVNGGVYLNLLFKETGKILDPSGEVIDITGNGADQLAIMKNNVGLSLFGSVGLHYRWNSAFDFILEPNVRVLVKSATVEGYSLDHKWITGGLITGVRYNF